MRMLYKFAICCVFLFSLPANAAFECYSGRPACLQFNNKVVSSDAVCFSSGTCSWGGFVCKSDYSKVTDMYDSLASNYDDLVSDYGSLRGNYNDLVSDYDSLRGNYNNLLAKHEDLISEYNDLVERYNELLSQ